MPTALPVRRLWGARRAVWRFAVAFTLFSFLFSLLSWGQDAEQPLHNTGQAHAEAGHLALHVALGALVASSAGGAAALAGGAAALTMDADSVAYGLGLPAAERASHSVVFLAVAAAAFWLMGRRRWLWPGLAPGLLAAVVAASVLDHVAVDALRGQGEFPLWAPVASSIEEVSRAAGAGLLAAAVALVWGASRLAGSR